MLPTDQQPKLRAGCMLLDKYYTRVPEACIPSSDWFEYLQCINLLIISIAVVDVDASLGWFSVLLKMWLELVIEMILVIVIVNYPTLARTTLIAPSLLLYTITPHHIMYISDLTAVFFFFFFRVGEGGSCYECECPKKLSKLLHRHFGEVHDNRDCDIIHPAEIISVQYQPVAVEA